MAPGVARSLGSRWLACAGPPEGHARVEPSHGHVLLAETNHSWLLRSAVGRQEVPQRGTGEARGPARAGGREVRTHCDSLPPPRLRGALWGP